LNTDTPDVRRQQVRSELQPADRAGNGAAEGFGEHGLADSRHVLDQQVSLGKQDDQCEVDGAALALDDALDRMADPSDHRNDITQGIGRWARLDRAGFDLVVTQAHQTSV